MLVVIRSEAHVAQPAIRETSIRPGLDKHVIVNHRVGRGPQHGLRKVPSINVAVTGLGTSGDEMYGNPQAGVEFHRSWTVGLLLMEMPVTSAVSPTLTARA